MAARRAAPRRSAPTLPNRPLPFVADDGGRAAAGFRGESGDCVTRAIAIAGGLDYAEVYDDLMTRARQWLSTTRSRKRFTRSGARRSPSPRNGMFPEVYRPFMEELLGWPRTATMGIGTGTTVHLARGELPTGRLVVQVSGHLCAVVDGVVHDTYDPCRRGTRAVYGYWTAG